MFQDDIKQPGFGTYLLAFFLPFVYFFVKRRFFAGAVSFVMCAVSLPLMIFVIGFFLYGAMASWAIWGVRNESIEAHAKRTGRATAEAILAAQQKPEGTA